MFYRQHRNNLHKAQMFTADQLNKEYDFIDWKVFFKHIFNARDFPGTQDQFIVNSPQYLKSVTGLMKTITEEEDFDLVKDFLHWRIVDSLVPLLTLPFRQARSDFSSQMSGVKKKYVIHTYVAHIQAELSLLQEAQQGVIQKLFQSNREKVQIRSWIHLRERDEVECEN